MALHQPTQIMLPMNQVVGVVTKVFNADDTVRRMITSEPAPYRRDHGPPQGGVPAVQSLRTDTRSDEPHVGDITEAGVRLLAHPFTSIAPSVNLYAERLRLPNGRPPMSAWAGSPSKATP